MPNLAHYVRKLSDLHRDVDPDYWVNGTLGQAPHKPILLLCVLDMYLADPGRENRIYPSETLEAAFSRYWWRVYKNGGESTLSLPFFHLQTDGFWHLVPAADNALVTERARRTVNCLRQEVAFAYLDSDLHSLLQQPSSLRHLLSVIITTNFDPELHERLLPHE